MFPSKANLYIYSTIVRQNPAPRSVHGEPENRAGRHAALALDFHIVTKGRKSGLRRHCTQSATPSGAPLWGGLARDALWHHLVAGRADLYERPRPTIDTPYKREDPFHEGVHASGLLC